MIHTERHRQHRTGWLRSLVLGANDGIISTASLLMGVTSANSSYEVVFLTGLAGLVAGAISMAAGEYVSVCSQVDIEQSDLAIERRSLDANYNEEMVELAELYEKRGIQKGLSLEVARQLMEYDALNAHARDDIGIMENATATPLLAATSSAASFCVGAILPLLTVVIFALEQITLILPFVTIICLSLLGGLSSHLSGAKLYKGVVRVSFWGAVAMASTFLIGTLFDVSEG